MVLMHQAWSSPVQPVPYQTSSSQQPLPALTPPSSQAPMDALSNEMEFLAIAHFSSHCRGPFLRLPHPNQNLHIRHSVGNFHSSLARWHQRATQVIQQQAAEEQLEKSNHLSQLGGTTSPTPPFVTLQGCNETPLSTTLIFH